MHCPKCDSKELYAKIECGYQYVKVDDEGKIIDVEVEVQATEGYFCSECRTRAEE